MISIFKRDIITTRDQNKLMSNIVKDIINADKTKAIQQICISSLSYKEIGISEVLLLDSNIYISVIVNQLENITDELEEIIYKYNYEYQTIQHVVIDIACVGDDNSDTIAIWMR